MQNYTFFLNKQQKSKKTLRGMQKRYQKRLHHSSENLVCKKGCLLTKKYPFALKSKILCIFANGKQTRGTC